VFFVPWWWYLWSRGPRFSLRRLLGRSLAGALAGAIFAGAAAWAFRGREGSPWLAALTFGEAGAVLAAAWSLVEPLWIALAASLLARKISTDALRGVSLGMVLAYAALAGYLVFLNAPHFTELARWLAEAERSDGPVGGSLRFIVGATLVCLPVVFASRQALIALDGMRLVPERSARKPAPRPAFGAAERRTHIPPPPPGPVPYEIPKPPPARVISSETGPLRPHDGDR
jgi:hypothetical protein